MTVNIDDQTQTEFADNADMKALTEFMLDIECLDPLSDWTSSFNLFDVLKISRAEIRHSNVLAWLITPSENHGLGDSVIRGFIQHAVVHSPRKNGSGVFDALLMDCHEFTVYREWHNIDLLAVSDDEKFLLCIENKIDSGEHDNQLRRYKATVEDAYPTYKKMYIFLSPDGDEASDSENWCSMSYTDVVEIIDSARKRVGLLPEPALLIQNYIDTIRRVIVGDERLVQICTKIYAKHKRALDLIFENKPDQTSNLAEILVAWAKERTEEGEIIVVPEKCVKTYTRFKTNTMSELFPDSEDTLSGWNTPNYYFYEIRNIDGKEFNIQLSFSSKDMPDKLRAAYNKALAYLEIQVKENWQWKQLYRTKTCKVNEDLEEKKIYEMLDKKLTEIKAFEARLKDYLTSSH